MVAERDSRCPCRCLCYLHYCETVLVHFAMLGELDGAKQKFVANPAKHVDKLMATIRHQPTIHYSMLRSLHSLNKPSNSGAPRF